VVLLNETRPTEPSHVRYGLFHGVPAFPGGRAWKPAPYIRPYPQPIPFSILNLRPPTPPDAQPHTPRPLLDSERYVGIISQRLPARRRSSEFCVLGLPAMGQGSESWVQSSAAKRRGYGFAGWPPRSGGVLSSGFCVLRLDGRQAGLREIRGHHLYVVLFKEGRLTEPSHVRYGLFHGVPAFLRVGGLRVCEFWVAGCAAVSQPRHHRSVFFLRVGWSFFTSVSACSSS
jgi:hypothetical protein